MMKGSSFRGLRIVSKWIEMVHYEAFSIDVGLVVFLLELKTGIYREAAHSVRPVTHSTDLPPRLRFFSL